MAYFRDFFVEMCKVSMLFTRIKDSYPQVIPKMWITLKKRFSVGGKMKSGQVSFVFEDFSLTNKLFMNIIEIVFLHRNL